MTDTNNEQVFQAWVDHEVIDPAGNKVGKVSQIYVDDQTRQPEWLAVNTGMFSSKVSFVPLQGAHADGDNLVIAFDKATVKDAPRVEEDADGFVTPQEEAELYRYYGRDYDTPAQYQPPTADEYSSSAGTEAADRTGTVGHDTSGPTTDEAMTRSEEELRVGTERREAGRVRLRKYVVTEQVNQTVPVSHEEIRVEREPITDANRGAATAGPDISDEEHEVTLHEERPVVQKEVIPRERVRLDTETVTDQETVSEEVRKEVIDTDEGTSPR